MSSNEHRTMQAVMATLQKIPQPPIKGRDPKLARVEVGTPEAYYLIATYCFDLERKLEYLTKVARPFAQYMPQDLAQEIDEDTAAINADGLSWQQRAIAAEAIMIRLHEENVALANR